MQRNAHREVRNGWHPSLEILYHNLNLLNNHNQNLPPPPQFVFDTRNKEAVCLNLLVDHQALEVFKKSKAEVQAAWLAGEEWAPGIQRGAVGVDTEERLEGDDALKSDYHPRRGRECWQQARQRIEPGL